ncbi:hypothetical protein FDP41_002803 [Naegleria fowleri]|uniref:Uncharacterized protein n=1 Tax=Naegleria fowleri TaxID=5763 RepID=A0A6A5BWU1_NAEFO|nr:uncharacterized protein FDP41_002803 [Naegleria fowleri]KAF0978288.1 hypothetical protein FDP41_002803 [Naegleria fowleri]CAG4710609.1 unnamed protein product [Naegleria fowleri]
MADSNKASSTHLVDEMLALPPRTQSSSEPSPLVTMNKHQQNEINGNINKLPEQPTVQYRLEFDELSERKEKRLKDLLRNDEYQFNYPLYNFDQKNYRRIPYLDPRFVAFKQHVEEGFAMQLAKHRQIADNHKIPLILSSFITSTLLWKKPKEKVTNYMLFITGTLGFSYLYSNNLAYGGMINRVNIETHRILIHEKKTYGQSEQQLKTMAEQIDQQIEKEMKERETTPGNDDLRE